MYACDEHDFYHEDLLAVSDIGTVFNQPKSEAEFDLFRKGYMPTSVDLTKLPPNL